jgi:hypothetical protein
MIRNGTGLLKTAKAVTLYDRLESFIVDDTQTGTDLGSAILPNGAAPTDLPGVSHLLSSFSNRLRCFQPRADCAKGVGKLEYRQDC